MKLKRNTNVTIRWCGYWQIGVTCLHRHYPSEKLVGAGDVENWEECLSSTHRSPGFHSQDHRNCLLACSYNFNSWGDQNVNTIPVYTVNVRPL